MYVYVTITIWYLVKMAKACTGVMTASLRNGVEKTGGSHKEWTLYLCYYPLQNIAPNDSKTSIWNVKSCEP